MSGVEVVATFAPSPADLAAAFWNMDSREQADFYAALERQAGHRLCLQTPYIVDVIRERADRGDYAAREAFMTLHGHAENYVVDGINYRLGRAKYAIARMGEEAREDIAALAKTRGEGA